MTQRRLLIIGNSHLTAPRNAYVAAPSRWAGWDVDTLAVPGRDMAWLAVTDGQMVATDADVARRMRFYNHVESVALGGYDAFAVVGGFNTASTAALCAGHRSADFPSMAAGAGDALLVGAGLVTAMLDQRIAASGAGKVLGQIAALGRPVAAAPEPLPAPACVGDAQYRDFADLIARGDWPHWAGLVAAARGRVLGPLAHLLDQPAGTVVDGCFTRADLMRGSVRLHPADMPPHDDTDHAHANDAYGAMVMDQITAALS